MSEALSIIADLKAERDSLQRELVALEGAHENLRSLYAEEAAGHTSVLAALDKEREQIANLKRQLAEVEAGASAMREALAPLVYLLPEGCLDTKPVLYDRDRWGNYSVIVDAGQIRMAEKALATDAGRVTLEELRQLRAVVQSALTQLEETGCCPICEAEWRMNVGLTHVEGCPLAPFDKQEGEGK